MSDSRATTLARWAETGAEIRFIRPDLETAAGAFVFAAALCDQSLITSLRSDAIEIGSIVQAVWSGYQIREVAPWI